MVFGAVAALYAVSRSSRYGPPALSKCMLRAGRPAVTILIWLRSRARRAHRVADGIDAATASGTITAEEDGYCTKLARRMSRSDLEPARWDDAGVPGGRPQRRARRASAGPGGAERRRLIPMNGSIRQCNGLFDLTCSTVLSNRASSCRAAAAAAARYARL